MVFLDVNTFYGPKAGGIRTYHSHKIEWFKKHPEHRYVLIGPAAERSSEVLAENIEIIRLKGHQMTDDPEGYRLLYDLGELGRIIDKESPDVIEAGEPWLTGIYTLWIQRRGRIQGVLSSFYHSDPVRTYFEPWSHKGHFSLFRKALVAIARPLFFWLQRKYDLTITSSRVMQNYLEQRKIRTALTPFGVSPAFFKAPAPTPPTHDRIRLVYAGRLDQEKGIEVLIEALPDLLEQERIEVTVIGRGSYEPFFSTYQHERYTYKGYFSDRDALILELVQHHVLIAPGPFETFALSVLEGMALGLPVIAPDQGGAGEILAEVQHAWSFEAGNVHSFLEAVERCLDSDWLVFSQRYRQTAEKYGTWERCFDRMAEVYHEEVNL